MGCSRKVALLTLIALAGCTLGARERDDLLADSGFTPTRADTAEWNATLKSLPPHRFAHRSVNGAPMVFYSDPVACHCVYSGTEAAFQRYRSLHREEVAAFDESVGGPGSFAQ